MPARAPPGQRPARQRIRAAKLQKLPYILVVGEDDVEQRTVGVNPRKPSPAVSTVERGVALDEFVKRLVAEVEHATEAALTK